VLVPPHDSTAALPVPLRTLFTLNHGRPLLWLGMKGSVSRDLQQQQQQQQSRR
jgi:hypothetical protein